MLLPQLGVYPCGAIWTVSHLSVTPSFLAFWFLLRWHLLQEAFLDNFMQTSKTSCFPPFPVLIHSTY